MKVIDNKKYFELAELKKMLKQKSWKDSWNVDTIYINCFIEFLEKIGIIEEDKQIEIKQLKTYSGENYSDDKELIVNKINEVIEMLNELKKESEE